MLLNCGVGEDFESPLDCKVIQPVHSKGDQSWVFNGRTDAKVETPILWPPNAKSWLIGKDPDAWRDWRQEEKGMTEDEMAGLHYWLYGHEFEWTLGIGDGQRGLACCDSWGRRESDKTEASEHAHSSKKLNKQSDNMQPWHTPFPILNQLIIPCSNCCFLMHIQVSQETGKVVWYFHLFKNFPVCCDPHSQRHLCSQWSRSRCFSGTPLLSLWSNKCWQFDLWFFCLF